MVKKAKNWVTTVTLKSGPRHVYGGAPVVDLEAWELTINDEQNNVQDVWDLDQVLNIECKDTAAQGR